MTKTLPLLFALALAACQPAEPAAELNAAPVADVDLDADRAALEEIEGRYSEALRTGDRATISALFADDGVILASDHPLVRGRDDIDAYGTEIDDGPEPEYDATTEVLEVSSSGDLAYVIGTDASAGDGAGKYLTVYRRVGGEWKIAAEAWNRDAPQVAATP